MEYIKKEDLIKHLKFIRNYLKGESMFEKYRIQIEENIEIYNENERLINLISKENCTSSHIPIDAFNLEVFAIKDCNIENSEIKQEAYIGYYLPNENFHFISVPFTETKK